MNRPKQLELLKYLLPGGVLKAGNFIELQQSSILEDQQQTNEVFSDKWQTYSQSGERPGYEELQRRWFLELYGFATEKELAIFLSKCEVIFDAGCGLGAKAAWFAELAPCSLVVAMDFSSAAEAASLQYHSLTNLVFVQGDIAKTEFPSSSVDCVICDQVIMHTENPEATFAELTRITRGHGGQVFCYFYAKKALPRELVDDYFRLHCKTMTQQEIWDMSEQLVELGKRLSDLNVSFAAPEIPALGIKAGTYDVQRFIYWNFLKCYWNPDLGPETSKVVNFDWYSPSNARRFGKDEVLKLIAENCLQVMTFHEEEACFSGRFSK